MRTKTSWHRLAAGPDSEAGGQAGREAAAGRFPTVRDCAAGLARMEALSDADLHRLQAEQAGQRGDRQRAAVRTQRKTIWTAGTGHPNPTTSEPPTSTPRRGHLLYLVFLTLLAALEALINFSVFEILGLGTTETRLVAVGVQLLLVHAAHQTGVRVHQALASNPTQLTRRLVHGLLFVVTAGALVGVIITLSVLRGSVFTAVLFSGADAGLRISTTEANSLFLSLTALLAAAAVDVGFAYAEMPDKARRRRERRSGRARIAISLADQGLCALERVQAEMLLARRAHWRAALIAFEQGFRSEAPVEILFELDGVSIPEVPLPSPAAVAVPTDQEAFHDISF